MGEHVFDLFARAHLDAVKIHLHPGRYAGDQRHVCRQCFIDDALQFFLPIFNAIGFVTRLLVGSKPCGHHVIGDAGKPAGFDPGYFIQLRAAG